MADGCPAVKPWLDGLPAQDYWIDPVETHNGLLFNQCSRCHTPIHRGDRVAKVFSVRKHGSEPKRGMRVGTVCAVCRDEADERKRAILGVFDKMGPSK